MVQNSTLYPVDTCKYCQWTICLYIVLFKNKKVNYTSGFQSLVFFSKKGNRENWPGSLEFFHLHRAEKGSISSKLFYQSMPFKQEVKDNG